MATPTGGMSDPEGGDGGGERQDDEAPLGGEGEELGAADHGERRAVAVSTTARSPMPASDTGISSKRARTTATWSG